MEKSVQRLSDAGWVLLPRFLHADVHALLSSYIRLLIGTGHGTYGDDQVPGCRSFYGDRCIDALLESATERVASAAGVKLVPTYSYVRVYPRGSVLEPHVDREACEYSLTISIWGDDPWPLELLDLQGESKSVVIPVAGAVLYRGRVVRHWRSRYQGQGHCQLFLHYVAAEGCCANEVFDRRPALGLPAATRHA